MMATMSIKCNCLALIALYQICLLLSPKGPTGNLVAGVNKHDVVSEKFGEPAVGPTLPNLFLLTSTLTFLVKVSPEQDVEKLGLTGGDSALVDKIAASINVAFQKDGSVAPPQLRIPSLTIVYHESLKKYELKVNLELQTRHEDELVRARTEMVNWKYNPNSDVLKSFEEEMEAHLIATVDHVSFSSIDLVEHTTPPPSTTAITSIMTTTSKVNTSMDNSTTTTRRPTRASVGGAAATKLGWTALVAVTIGLATELSICV